MFHCVLYSVKLCVCVVEYLFFWWNLRFLFFGLLFGFGGFSFVFVFLVFAKLCGFHTNICIFFTKLCEFFSNICFVCLRTFCWFWLFVLFFIFGGFFGLGICLPLVLTLLFVGIRILVLWASFSLFLHLQLYFFNCKMVIVHDFRLHLQYYFFNCIIYIQV